MKEINSNNTLVRLIIMIVVGINSIAMLYGYQLIPFTSEEVAAGISAVALVISEVYNHWKNNDYTTEAKEATKQLKEQKKAK
jgi:SPP1 family holin